MKGPLLFLALSFTACHACSGQTHDGRNQVQVEYSFQPNSTLRYEIEQTLSNPRFPGSENVKFSRELMISTSPVEDGQTRCTWKYGPLKVTGETAGSIPPMTRAVQSVIKGLQISFITDGKERISEIVNWEACKKHVMAGIDSIKRNLPATPSRARDELSEILKTMQSRCQTPKTMLGTYCPELAIYFRIMGETLQTGSVLRSASGLSNPLGGPNLPAEQRMQLDQLTDSVAIISIHKAVPQAYLKDNLPGFSMTVDFTYRFNYRKNVVMEVFLKKSIEQAGSGQKDEIRMTLQ